MRQLRLLMLQQASNCLTNRAGGIAAVQSIHAVTLLLGITYH